MKILHVITCVDDAGGAEKLMEDLLPGLKKEGVDVSCLVFYGFDSKNRRTIEAAGIKVYELSHNKHYYSPIKILKLIPYVRKFDIVHTHNTPAVMLTAIANLFGKAILVTTEHSTGGRMRQSKILQIVDKWIHRQYKAMICCSDAAEKSLREKVNPKHAYITTVNNGVKLKKFTSAVPSPEIGGKGIKSVAMVAWFREPKDHKTVMDAIKLLPENFHVFFVGAGPNLEGCKEYAKQLSLDKRSHFLGLRTDVPEILKAADYIVLASHYEGLSLSSVEGMSVGKPFLASDVNGLREIVGGAGILFPDGDAKKLADSILELDQHPDLYQEVAEKCHQRAMQYDISSMVKGYKEVYEKLNK